MKCQMCGSGRYPFSPDPLNGGEPCSVCDVCLKALKLRGKRQDRRTTARRRPPQGGMWTYLIQAGDGPVKIGRSSDVAKRVVQLQVGSHERLAVLAVAPADKEADLHARFAAHRIGGEWFRPTEELLQEAAYLREAYPALLFS